MGDEVADAVDVGGFKAEFSEQGACGCGSFFFLELAAAHAVFCFGGFYADVVGIGGGFEDEQGVFVDVFTFADELGEAMDFDEVLYAFGVAMVVFDHGVK